MQAAALERRGFDTVYRADELDDFIKAARPGSLLGIHALQDLANPKIKPPAARRRDLWRILSALPRDAVLEDADGRRSDTDSISMIADAVEAITQARRAAASRRNGSKSAGRPPKYSAEDRERVRPIWHSREHETAEDAIKHMPGWSIAAAYRLLGARG